MLLDLLDCLLRQLLSRDSGDDILLSCPPVTNADDDAGQDVDRDGETQNHRRDPRWSTVIAPGPRKGAQHDLKDGVKIQQHDCRDHKLDRERMVRTSLMRLVERVRLGEFGLMVDQFFLFRFGQYNELRVCRVGRFGVCFLFRSIGKVVVVFECGHLLLFPYFPSFVMVLGDPDHMIRVDNSKRCHAIADYGKQGH